ncbi:MULTISPECIES: uracil-DNA glycosylase [Dehalococcoides]|uniref:Type-4 uracil-DNA glycosylase n=1 Tax=Dehalococcoides mccartyi TaxID=61435 RepID=A0AB38ZBC4_9CHLR|nr:uracil-DNA glycosylase [Dehalococcoides mccartyi]WRO07888.1 uracil-DNA glycosylase [Dehalococcoides mccartyi]
MHDKEELLKGIYSEIAQCARCNLHTTRTHAVPGEGNADAKIMFIGEAPGFNEDQQGRPFVGAAGKFLTELIHSIGLRREDVYITNVVKDRPPGNRDPLPDEISACRNFLDRQIEIIKPKIIVTLGRYSMARYFTGSTISRIHGKPMRRDGVIYYPMYHPAAALHQGGLRKEIEQDMLRIPGLLEELNRAEAPLVPKEPPARQLGLF